MWVFTFDFFIVQSDMETSCDSCGFSCCLDFNYLSQENINSPDVRAYFETLGLDVWDVPLVSTEGGRAQGFSMGFLFKLHNLQ